MSRIQALDEITARLGPPAFLRWLDAPYGATAAVVRFRHHGATVDLSASGTSHLIFHLSSSQVVREGAQRSSSVPRTGGIVASFTQSPERIRILGAADTLHLLFSSELAKACGADSASRVSPDAYKALQAGAVQTLVAAALGGMEAQLQEAVGSVAKALAENQCRGGGREGGLTPQASRAVRDLLERRIARGVSVPELAEVAGLSLHHFIKVCRQSEGFTPHALLLQRRLERSISLLLNRKASVEEVALLVGFSSPSHFISTFRRLVGVTPASLRRAAAA